MPNSCLSFKLPELNILSLRRGNSSSSLQHPSSSNPYCVVIDFTSVTEKECGKLDTMNEKKYQKLISKANKAEKTIHKTGLSMNLEVPPPPHPSNRDRYIIWKKRNVSRKVIPQSEAIVFLTKNNLVLNEDYEAYQAIDLATEIKKEKGISLHTNDRTHNFDNVYNHHDKNILRRRSMYRTNKHLKPHEVQQPPSYPMDSQPSQSHSQQQINYPPPLPLPPSPPTFNLRNTQPLPVINNPNSGFYPNIDSFPNNQEIPSNTQSLPSAPSAPSAPQISTPQKNNIRFSVSCSAHECDSDTSF